MRTMRITFCSGIEQGFMYFDPLNPIPILEGWKTSLTIGKFIFFMKNREESYFDRNIEYRTVENTRQMALKIAFFKFISKHS